MQITSRLILALLVVAAIVAALFSYIQVRNEEEVLNQELDARASILGESLQESIKEYLGKGDKKKLNSIVERFGDRTRLVGIAVYDSQGVGLAASPALRPLLDSTPSEVWESITRNMPVSGSEEFGGKRIHLNAIPINEGTRVLGNLLLYHDASYINERLSGIWRTNFIRLLALIFLLTITTVLVVRWSIMGPVGQVAKWVRNLRIGRNAPTVRPPRGDILGPLTAEVALMAKSLAQARASAQEEARLRVEAESLWTAERLKEHVKVELQGRNLFVVSNREPYMHEKHGSTTDWVVPAGGLVTALDPILRACGGIWIAHGSGNADRETADGHGHIAVPPDEPAYTLRRVFLTKEEEEGYYYGFSNEGIWPLCHITHTRPIFRLEDWIQYQNVNQKFADALLDELEAEESPLVLIQDYHFALLPLLVKNRKPDARVAIFWHIPWPNPEVFSICPWKKEILIGLLGADLIGFHIQFHCNNFLESVDRFLESKINWDQFSVERQGQISSVRPFPISVAERNNAQIDAGHLPQEERKAKIFKKLGVSAAVMGVGVDRIDYTKGILERFRAVERFLTKYPQYIGRFTFVELGAPSRTHIKRYHDLMVEIEEAVERINWALQTRDWKPIVLLKANHTHETINEYYRAADLCMVTSLHDGMNLVAKEFVASRDDEDGMLILSQFTGAARELQDALIVNPYDVEETADAIFQALEMKKSERMERMRQLRAIVSERNVFRWAANIITSLSRLRMMKQQPA